jgi:hypothetical protein
LSAAVFRGGATGRGVTSDTNMRLRVCALSLAWHQQSRHAPPLLDARLTSWNPRHKWGSAGELTIIDPATAAPPLTAASAAEAHRLPLAAQARWKYYVLVDGNVGASRLGELAELRFVVLWARSRLPQVMHARELQPWVHFVPLSLDLSDLEERLLWCRANDTTARSIAEALHDLVAPRLSQRRLERVLARTLQELPAPLATEAFSAAAWWLWEKRRSGVYVLMKDCGELLEFRPFANAQYTNTWPAEAIEPAKVTAFLDRCAALWPNHAPVTLPPRRWWSNGALVCNVLPRNVWGDSMLAELHCMILGSGAALRQSAPPGLEK